MDQSLPADQLSLRRQLRLLHCELLALRLAAARYGSGASIHGVNGCISNVQAVLFLVERELQAGRTEIIADLMTLAADALRSGRSLVYQAARSKLPGWEQDETA